MTDKQVLERGRQIYIRIHGHDIESECKFKDDSKYVGTLFD